jgi:uncharacterized membrane protein
MDLTTIGAAHLTAAITALVVGLAVFPAAKGTSFHRAMGFVYVLAMLAVNVTALGMYRLTGQFNMFHVLALVSLLAVLAGLFPLLRRTPGWLLRHYRPMIGSYFGLWAAAVAESLTRVPALRALLPTPESVVTFGVSVAVVFFVVSFVVNRRLARTYAHSGPG